MVRVPHGRVERYDEDVTVRTDRPRQAEIVAERCQLVVKQPRPNECAGDDDRDNHDGDACLLCRADGSEVELVADNEIRIRQVGADGGSRGTRGAAGKVASDDR